MNRISKIGLVMALLSSLACGMVMAEDTVKNEAPQPSFQYKELKEPFELRIMNEPVTIHEGQLSFSMNDLFFSGMIYRFNLPEDIANKIMPYFKVNLTQEEWDGVSEINKDFLNPDSELNREIKNIIAPWAKGMTGINEDSELSVRFQDVEPFRKVSMNKIMYTAGGKIILNSGNFRIPMYIRCYFIKNGNSINTLLMVTPDEGKQPLLYELEDMANDMYEVTMEEVY